MKLEKLITKAKKGYKKAFSKLIELEQSKLYKMAFLYTKDRNDALDIVQDTVYKALLSIDNLKEPKYFTTWITKILINTSLDFIKKKKKVVLLDSETLDKITFTNLNMDDKIDLYAIDQLNERYKTIIILRYYQDQTIKQVADIVGVPEGTVKSNHHRAIQTLKLNIKEECSNE